MIHLHDLHSNHDQLEISRDEAETNVPRLAWNLIDDRRVSHEKRQKRFREKKELWAKDAKYAFKYAAEVLNGPFKLGEPAIAKSAQWSWHYADRVLHGPFKLGEPAIAKSAQWSWHYADRVLHGPFKLGERAIKTDQSARNLADWPYLYARHVLKLSDEDAKSWGSR